MRSCGTNQSSSFYLSISFWVGSALATGQAGHWASRPATGKPTLDLRTQTPRQKQAKRTRLAHATNKPGKQTSWRAAHLSELARQLHAVQYFEPRAGHGAHVQSGTSLSSLPVCCVVCANACDSRGHGDRHARVHGMRIGRAGARYQLPSGCAVHAPAQFEAIPGNDMLWRRPWCLSRVRPAAQHERARRAHALGAAPFVLRSSQWARADLLPHEGGGP